MQLYQQCSRSRYVRRSHAGSLEEGKAWWAGAGEARYRRVDVYAWRDNVRLDLVLWLSNSGAWDLQRRWTPRGEGGEDGRSSAVTEELLRGGPADCNGGGRLVWLQVAGGDGNPD